MKIDITYHTPTKNDEDILKDYVQEHYDNGEKHINASCSLSQLPYDQWLQQISAMQTDSTSPEWGKSYFYMVCYNDHLIGLVHIRPFANESISNLYGHIGYGIRPSYRGYGFAEEILKFAIQECKKYGLQQVLLGCLKNNIPSAKTILRCGGQLIREEKDDLYKPGEIRQYYRILLNGEVEKPEIWDLYDEKRRLVATEHIRGTWPIPDNLYHLVVHVWIRNSEGKFLIAQRSAKRKNNPLKWECSGGSVIKGEDSLTGAIREVKEEVGIDLNPLRGHIVFSRLRDVIDGKRFGDIMDVWLFESDDSASLLNATTDEVAQTKWATIEEIRNLYDNGEFVQTLGYFFDKLTTESVLF